MKADNTHRNQVTPKNAATINRRRFIAGGAVALASLSTPATAFGDAQTADGAGIHPTATSSSAQSDWQSALSGPRRHTIVRDLPTPDFFEGMLLGNGDIGVCVTVRPDALGLHIGKSDAWDIRVSEDHMRDVLPFSELLELWNRAGEEAKRQNKPDMTYLENDIGFFSEYTRKVSASYGKPWPRPWPCGIVWIQWNAAILSVHRQTLDISNGLFCLELLSGDEAVSLYVFVNTQTGHICVYSDSVAEIWSVAYHPHVDDATQMPMPEVASEDGGGRATFSAFQLFPSTAPTAENPHPPASDQDRNFAMNGVLQGNWNARASQPHRAVLDSSARQRLRLDIVLTTPRDCAENRTTARLEADKLSAIAIPVILQKSAAFWLDYWSRSAVEIADTELERIWYHNQYWLACCLRKGKVAPGLFGNWVSGSIGTSWHGDYHMNYNTQQPYWGVFSSNHIDQHFPYIELCESLLPLGEDYAKRYFKLPGAFFPHSAYPVPSKAIAYPAAPWGYEICETPWTVQSLWWHYLYTLDETVLRRVYPMMRAASEFLVAYVGKERGGKYHIVPSVSPENWGCTVDFRLNRDCIIDIALSQFALKATAEAARILNVDQVERQRWTEVAQNLAGYPKTEHAGGTVWLDVPDAPAGWVYNIPVTLAPVFPGEQVGLGMNEQFLPIARHTAETIRLEGGNDIVYQPLIRARLGRLDLAWFKREVRYCQMPNGIVQDRVRQIGGRYDDGTDFDFMIRKGVWVENFSLPGVINECLMQSYTGTIYLFPNTTNLGPVRFHDLRAVGAFLITAAWDGRKVSGVELLSEKGAALRMKNSWKTERVDIIRLPDGDRKSLIASNGLIEMTTKAGELYRISEAL
jgi:alpha-L-fucosidase 2